MSKFIKSIIVLWLMALAQVSYGKTLIASPNEKLFAKVSKTGLNRISNSPYQIVQVTGDESKFRLKFDGDGANIYLMPLVESGEKLEISVKNNMGSVFDMELAVANIRGQSINIDSSSGLHQKTDSKREKELRQMLKAMQEDNPGKYYVQRTKLAHPKAGKLDVMQIRLVRWKNLVGGVFKVKNKTKTIQTLDLQAFSKRFDNLVVSFVTTEILAPKEEAKIFLIQEKYKEQ